MVSWTWRLMRHVSSSTCVNPYREHSPCEGIVKHRNVILTTTYRYYPGRTLPVCKTASMYAHVGGWFQT